MTDTWTLAGHSYSSRLLVGTGRYRSFDEMVAAVEASGAQIVTVAVRRALPTQDGRTIEDALPPARYTYLPNSAGCYTAEDAVRTLRLAREAGGGRLVKLEVIGDKATLLPDMPQTLKAADILVKDGFAVMAYMDADPEMARRLEEAGCAAVMPLASPIGTGLGIQHPERIAAIVQKARVPVLVDAGIGTASDAAIAMELGCAAVLLNTAIAEAKDAVRMAEAMKLAVQAGRLAYLAGRMPKRDSATPSSPVQGIIAANS